MEEAETLCDHVAIIDYGKIVALDTVPGLKQAIPRKDRVELVVAGVDMEKAAERLKAVPGAASADHSGESIILSSDKGAEIIPEAVEALRALGGRVSRVTLKEQTLEDVFIHYTGRPIREEEAKKVSFLLGAGIPTKWGR
ncbi:MAG: DUF4162 domain-containing protein [Deltaproteobacteria bacterium]|nr:DUF4162 domain-containing protein [Deltaproteobacteria bacterium]